MLRLQVGSTCVLNDAKVEIKSARCKSFCRPGCTAIVHPGLQTVYMKISNEQSTCINRVNECQIHTIDTSLVFGINEKDGNFR
jgi:hypothetical protein